MRSSCVLMCASLLACTGPVEPESFELPALEPAAELPDWDYQPDAAPPPVDPGSQPRLELRLGPVDEEEFDRFCGYDVLAHGFPAVELGGTTMVSVAGHVDSNSDGEDEYMVLSWLHPDRDAREQLVYNRGDDFRWAEGEESDDCEQAIRDVREQVAMLNAELSSSAWMPLERLDVVDIDGFLARTEYHESIDTLPLAQRPVEVLYRGGRFIARVRQAKVLVELERPQWQRDDEYCTRNPNMRMLFVDRRTGLALVFFDHSSGGCLCDDHQYVDALRLPAELFAEVDRRPSSVLAVL